MNRVRTLYALIAADVFLAFATIGVESVFHKFLPPTLADHQMRSWLEWRGGATAVFELAVWAASVAAFLIAWIGLASFWPRAREIYLAAWSLTALSLALGGPSVLTSPGSVLDSVGTLVSGALIGLVWFSELAPRYAPGRSGSSLTGSPATASS